MPPTVSHRLKTSSCFSASGIEASSLSITTRVRERKSKANSLDSSSSILKSDLVTCESISLISGCRKKFKRWIISLKIFKFFKFNDNTQFSRFWEFFSLKFYILTREEEIDSREKWKRVIVREFYSWRKSFLIIVNNRSMWLWHEWTMNLESGSSLWNLSLWIERVWKKFLQEGDQMFWVSISLSSKNILEKKFNFANEKTAIVTKFKSKFEKFQKLKFINHFNSS